MVILVAKKTATKPPINFYRKEYGLILDSLAFLVGDYRKAKLET